MHPRSHDDAFAELDVFRLCTSSYGQLLAVVACQGFAELATAAVAGLVAVGFYRVQIVE